MKLSSSLPLLMVLFSIGFLNAEPLTVKLWNDEVPFNRRDDNTETLKVLKNGGAMVGHVSIPEMTVFPAVGHADEPTTAILICPGGGYQFLALDHEGRWVAEFLAENGYTAIVLKNRLPDHQSQVNAHQVPLFDVQRAMFLIRKHANAWNIHPDQVGIMGFSAGGHLAATASNQWNQPILPELSPETIRPDFSVLIYPVISFQDEITHLGSRRHLLGEGMTEVQKDQFSNELQVTAQTPPAFIVHSVDDGVVPVENSIRYAKALSQHDISYEMHLFPVGGHGYGLLHPHTQQWGDLLVQWLKLNVRD